MKKKILVFCTVALFILVNFISPKDIKGVKVEFHEWYGYDQGCYSCILPDDQIGAKYFCEQASTNYCFGYTFGGGWVCVGGIC